MKKLPFGCVSAFALLALTIPAGLTACGGGSKPAAAPTAASLDPSSLPASTKVETKNDPAFASCHNTFKPPSADKDVASDVATMAKGCADVTKMKKVGDTLSGQLSEKGAPVTFPLS